MDREQSLTNLLVTQQSTVKKWWTGSWLVVLIVGTFVYLNVNPLLMILAVPGFMTFLVSNFFPANFSQLPTYVPLIVETLLFAVVGTYFSAFLAFFFGLLISEKTNPLAWLRFCCRLLMSFLRNIPVLVWAALLVYVFGIGNMVGLIALVIATLGFLARSYAETMNEIAGSKLEALKASGASYFQVLYHGLIPEFLPAWLNWTLFSFEINIRASAILGMVGAGGIGIMIQTNIRLFKYHEAAALIVVLVTLVLLTEFAVNKLRKLVR